MSDEHSVTMWIEGMKSGNEDAANEAANKIVRRYFDRLVRLARRRYPSGKRPAEDEEDAAQAALASFWKRAPKGYFPRLENRDDLWALLTVITIRKVYNQIRREQAAKRKPSQDEDLGNRRKPKKKEEGLPFLVAEANCTFVALLQSLERPDTKQIANLLLEGLSPAEIADKLDVAKRTVERKRDLIRKKLEALVLK